MEIKTGREQVEEAITSLNRKFEVQDIYAMSAEARTFAAVWARDYEGSFDYMIQMRTEAQRDLGLTTGQIKGILNCYRAEFLRKEQTKTAPVNAAETEHVVGNGFYTVSLTDGSHVTLRVENSYESRSQGQGRTRGTKGSQVVSFLFGPDNMSSYRAFALIVGNQITRTFAAAGQRQIAALNFLLGNLDRADEFGMAYAQESGNCYRCGRLLTDPTSIENGIGPVCIRYVA